jgi:hypothetical protein
VTYTDTTKVAWHRFAPMPATFEKRALLAHLAAQGVAHEKSGDRIGDLGKAIGDGTADMATVGEDIRRCLLVHIAAAQACFAACAALDGWTPETIHETITDSVQGPENVSEWLWSWSGYVGDPWDIAPADHPVTIAADEDAEVTG